MSSAVRTDRRRLKEKDYERFLGGADARFGPARVLRERYAAILEDLGGPERTSYMQRSLAKRFCAVEARVEQAELALVQGDPPPMTPAEYLQAVNCLIGLAGRLGIRRQPKPVKSLQDHISKATK